MGMLHRWPAVRLGGVDPPMNRTIQIPFSLNGVPNATQARITITQATGATSVQLCSASPCGVAVDARAGSVLMKLDYLSAAGALLSPGEAVPLYVPR